MKPGGCTFDATMVLLPLEEFDHPAVELTGVCAQVGAWDHVQPGSTLPDTDSYPVVFPVRN